MSTDLSVRTAVDPSRSKETRRGLLQSHVEFQKNCVVLAVGTGTNVFLKNKSSCSFSKLSVGAWSSNTLRLKVCWDVFSVLVFVSLIEQSECVSWIYRPLMNGVIFADLNLKQKRHQSKIFGNCKFEKYFLRHRTRNSTLFLSLNCALWMVVIYSSPEIFLALIF